MPHRIACRRCERVGLVRCENVIKGTRVSVIYYCGACDFEWTVEATPGVAGEAQNYPPPPRGRSRTIRVKRRA